MNEENPLAPSLRLLWHGLPAPEKGPRPRLSLPQIVDAAVALADEGGLDGLSMRTLARELGVGTMSLYRYVPSKTELLNLMLDSVSAPAAEDSEAVHRGWRTALEAAARSTRRMFLRHPWVLQASWTRPVMGPNSMAAMDLRLSGLHGLPLSDREKMGVLSAVDAYVMGLVRQEVLWQGAAEESGMTDEEFWQHQVPFFTAAMASGRFPALTQLADDTFDASWEEGFAFGLTMFLDGVEQTIVRRRGGGDQEQRACMSGPDEPMGRPGRIG